MSLWKQIGDSIEDESQFLEELNKSVKLEEYIKFKIAV